MATSMLGRRMLLALTKNSNANSSLLTRCLQLYPSPKTTEEEAEKEVQYPSVKPRYPPGAWGKMLEKHAWRMYDEGERIKSLPRLRERLIELNNDVIAAPKWKVRSLDENVGVLPYQQFITRTHLKNGLPETYSSLEIADDKIELISMLVEQCLEEEMYRLERDHVTCQYPPVMIESVLQRYLVGRIVDIVVSVLCGEQCHLLRAQVDSNVDVQASWRVSGFPDDVKVRGRDVRGHVRFVSEFNVSKQIRTEFPLPPVEDMGNAGCQGDEPFTFDYSPKTVGQFTESHIANKLSPGFRVGDPCQFTSVLVNDYSGRSGPLSRRYSTEEVGQMVTGLGMLSGFSSLVAQAHYLGFNMYQELTYPLVTQTVNTDGQHWSFYIYQLNTLQLFKDQNAEPKHNLCWYTDRVKLYDEIGRDGVVGFNSEALRNLVKFVARTPVENEEVNLRPFLSAEFNPVTRDFKDFFPYRPKYPRWCPYPEFLEGSVQGYV